MKDERMQPDMKYIASWDVETILYCLKQNRNWRCINGLMNAALSMQDNRVTVFLQ